MSGDGRIPVLYLAPWVSYGGSDRNTIDWFRWIDRERFAPSLITTQPSDNALIGEVERFAEEVWVLPDLMPAEKMPGFILDFIQSRDIRVVHLMNSRIGFDLMPDFACVDDPPAIVVQLHVEEEDRSGYVRYVTSRYGNLVDRFSISNEHVAKAVEGYGIPRDRIEVIYTGVDAEEFSPERVAPVESFPEDRLDVLFAARLVPQKDPLLMVDVASALCEREVDFRFHVVGDGELQGAIEERATTAGVRDRLAFHPPTPGLGSWYAASDAMLMTSTFEGVPVVVFEAMAMGLPIVAPGLPGIREMLDGDEGLVDPRDSVAGYADRLARLAGDHAHREATSRRLRERAREQFSVREMAERHGAIYAELAASAPEPPSSRGPLVADPVRFRERPPAASQPLVSVIVPHFNQGGFLNECIEAIRAQTYPNVEIVVVDDASTEGRSVAALDQLEAAEDLVLIRQRQNRGPSHARNVGVERSTGRYLLPVDSDNLLLPGAIEDLVAQLSEAGEEIGFVYPNLQYFGNREDYYEVPQYNLYTLLYGNFCDTCSLLDREIFAAGIHYSEDIHLGHEDWEFVLRLAARGIRGEAARGPTVLYRKWGFNRSDLVDHAPDDFRDDVLAEISPFRGREAEIKAQESPAVSLIALNPPEDEGSVQLLADRQAEQRCVDFELIVSDGGDALRLGLEAAKGAFAAVTVADPAELLAEPGFVAKLLRRFDAAEDDLDAIALVDAGEEGRFGLRALPPGELEDAVPHTLIWRRRFETVLPRGLYADPGDPVASLATQLSGAGAVVEWRHAPAGIPRAALSSATARSREPLPEDPANRDDPLGLRPAAQPILPGIGSYRVPRWERIPTWLPPLSTIAMRYLEPQSGRRIVTNGGAPAGFHLEHHLGALRSTAFEGTVRIVRVGDEYMTVPRGEWSSAPEEAVEIGYAEVASLPGLDAIALAVHRSTGQQVLVSLSEDPLLSEVDLIEHFGFLDPFPLRPRETPFAERPLGLVGLTKTADSRARRHRYGLGTIPEGELLDELGGLATSDLGGSIGAWVVDGYLVTERYRPPTRRPSPVGAARWSVEPLAWRGTVPTSTWAKVMGRRMLTSAGRAARPTRFELEPSGEPEAWLFESGRPGLAPLHASHHPVTGDQLLTRSAEDAAQMGYSEPQLLGFVRSLAPLTGDLAHRPLPVPWARRFGAVPQTG